MGATQRGLRIRSCPVGPWPMNAYAFVCPSTHASVLVDPGCDPEALGRLMRDTEPTAILLTHTHPDHVSALDAMRGMLRVPVYAGPGPHFGEGDVPIDRELADGELIAVGEGALRAALSPGHTADHVCFVSIKAEPSHAAVGDAVFDGGPGKTWSAAGFAQTLATLERVVLSWPDDTVCHPGHGLSFRLGDRRAAIEAFLAKDHGDFYGDATWDM
jgi:glyoxylase-like metal-dependent hydrolase (beta-lactamase superfamily II)